MLEAIPMKLYEIIGAARAAKNLTLREVEEKSGVSNAMISQIETGQIKNPGFRMVVRIAKALKIPLKKLAESE